MTLPATIYSPATFKGSLPAGFDGAFDWEWMIPAIQQATRRNIRPMDIDAHVEINGQHLIFETKGEGVPIPAGQRRALMQLWAKGYTTLVFLIGKTFPISAEIFYPSGKRRIIKPSSTKKELTRDELVEFVSNWSAWADRNKCPFSYNGD